MIYVVYIGWYDGPGVDFIIAFHDKEKAEEFKRMIEIGATRPVFVKEVQICDQ